MNDDQVQLRARVEGHVQGVGFRWFVQQLAMELALAGSAANLDDGSVEVVAEGPRSACEQLAETLHSGRTPGQVRSVQLSWLLPTGKSGFRTR